jgi:small-conductance mechanosensitive channel
MSNQDSQTVQDINIELPEISIGKANEAAIDFYDTAKDYLIDQNYWIPITTIILSMIFGMVFRGFLRPKLLPLVDKLNISFRFNRILKNLTKLTLQIGALIFLSLVQAVLIAVMPDLDLYIMKAATKLLIAWILIRMVAQIIENGFVRQIVALTGWAIAALSILGVMDQTKSALDAVGMDFGEWRLSLLTIAKFTIAICVLLTITKLLTNGAERSLSRATDLTPSARVLLVKVIKVIMVSLAILIGVTTAGIDLSALAIFGGALGLGIGFGLQKVISNLFSGMLLLVDKSIKPGDIIELQDGTGVFGWVSHLGARYVSLITRDNKEYLIPNEDFITQPVINWSYSDRKIRVETKFGVDYASDPHQVKKIGIEVASNTKRVCADPKPVCHLVEFGDSSLNFVLRYWIEDAENGVTNTKGDIMLGLWDAFKENDIEIPFPHRVLIEKK